MPPSLLRILLTATAGSTLACARVPPPEIPVRAVGQSAHFSVVCHFDCGTLAAQAAAVAESVWPAATHLYGPPAPDRVPPLRIHLYGSEGFRATDVRLSGGRFDRNQAFALPAARAAHVLVPPGEGLSSEVARRVAHEAAHLASYALLPAPSCLPDWLSEGAASWVEREVAAEGAGGAEGDPLFRHHLRRVAQLVRGERLPPVEWILSDAPVDSAAPRSWSEPPLRTGELYALTSVFFEFLRTHSPELLSALVEAERARAAAADCGSGHSPPIGERRLARLESAFREYVASAVRSVSGSRLGAV